MGLFTSEERGFFTRKEKSVSRSRQRRKMAPRRIRSMIPSSIFMLVLAAVSYATVLYLVTFLRGYCEENECGARRMFVNAGH